MFTLIPQETCKKTLQFSLWQFFSQKMTFNMNKQHLVFRFQFGGQILN